jgi:predicted transcriptional regulator
MGHPRKDPKQHAVNAGVSFPPDIKRRVQELAAIERKTASRYVLDLVLEKFEKADAALERQTKGRAAKANESMKKRR